MTEIEKALQLIDEGKIYACLILLQEKASNNVMLQYLEEKFITGEVDDVFRDKLRLVAYRILSVEINKPANVSLEKDWRVYMQMYLQAIFHVGLGLFIVLISLTTDWAGFATIISTPWNGRINLMEYGLYTNNLYFTFGLLLYCGMVVLHDTKVWEMPFYLRVLMLCYFVYHLLAWFIVSFWEEIFFKAGYLFNVLVVVMMVVLTYKDAQGVKWWKKK